MAKLLLASVAIGLSVSAPLWAAETGPLLSRDLTGIPGKEGVILEVTYAPGQVSSVHRHNANVFVYMLEGELEMQVEGAAPVRLHPGQTFYEGPGDVHSVGRNVSQTAPARFIAFFVKNKGAPFSVPVK